MADSKARNLTSAPDATRSNRAGPRRSHVPVYLDRLPPCNNACPAGENIQTWLAHVQHKEYEKAWRVIVNDNPLPAVHGRVCYHPCESACNRADVDATINIHAVERFLGDMAIEKGWTVEPPAIETGKRVLVVGAGPSGLSAAYHLRLFGHTVEIQDAGPVAGGMMRFGIPSYRLPRNILDAEIARIAALGVTFTFGKKIVDLDVAQHLGQFDAVFVAIGAQLSRRAGIPACDAGRVIDAMDFLRDVDTGEKPLLGRRVAVYGGGNTALDSARTAKRLGASETIIVYRRNRDRAPAHDEEIADAMEEGIKFSWLSTIAGIEGDSLKIEKMKLNDEGWPEPTGEFETLDADHLILALGQDTDTAFLRNVDGLKMNKDGTVIVDETMMSSRAGWFMGGDMVPSERTVTIAVGHGKKAARNINAWLGGSRYAPPVKHEVATGDYLNLWYYSDAEIKQQDRKAPQQRVDDFSEVVASLSPDQALYEARRCLSCGNCFECDGCYGACPEDAIIKLGQGKRYRYDYDRCTGCGVCYEQCPCGAINMVAEEKV